MDENTAAGLNLNTVLSAFTVAIATLATAVGCLWKVSEAKNTKAIEALEERAESCEQDRTKMRETISQQDVRIARLETRLESLNDRTN